MVLLSVMIIERARELNLLKGLLKRHRVVAIVGARQVGKTTLARQLRGAVVGHYFDLENSSHAAQLAEPLLALAECRGLVVIDEIQRAPRMFDALRVLVDQPRTKRRFLILGSASPDLLRQGSESLAGRIVYHELAGLGLDEVGSMAWRKLWLRGGFPRSFLARSGAASFEWRTAFIRTFLERDLPSLGIGVAPSAMGRFWTMLAHYHGQVWNASEFGRSFGVADTTVRNYLDALSSALVVRQLSPWHENLGKRQIKSPKIYIKDVGLLHGLLNLRTSDDLLGHPKVGASWEGFGLEQVIRHLRADANECYFWGSHSGAELDLLVVRGRQRRGFEFKFTAAPKITPSMKIAMSDLRLDRLEIIHAGEAEFPMGTQIRAIPLNRLSTAVKPLR